VVCGTADEPDQVTSFLSLKEGIYYDSELAKRFGE
jgi:hypothetical protein